MRRLAAMVVVMVLGTMVPVFAQTGNTRELTLGDWNGVAWASGFAWESNEEVLLTWVATIESRYEFTVTEEGLEGQFDLSSRGIQGNDSMRMHGVTSEGEFSSQFNIDPGAGGELTGTRTEINFESGPVTTSGRLVTDVYGSPFEVAIAGAPSKVAIRNLILHLTCDLAVGDWYVSITQQIEDEGWNPEWSGHWIAARVPPSDQETEQEELIDDLVELLDDFNDYQVSLGRSTGPDPDFDPLAIRSGPIIELVNRASEIANRLHNLSPCDAAAIGSETLEQWQTSLAGMVGDLVLTAAEAVAAQGVIPPFDAVVALVQASDATGAYGAGSPLGAGQSFQIEDALIELTSKSIEGHLRLSEGNDDEYRWAAGGVAIAVAHGWPVTVDGITYSPTEAIALVAEPPGGDG